MSDVFVSYKAEDRKRVRPLVEALEAEGYSVWWDEQIGGGASWRRAIEAELNAAKCVVVAWSKRSVGPDGAFVQDEATRAQHRRVYVPVLIDKVHLPLGFGETQALPLVGWKGDRSAAQFGAVLKTVRGIIGDTHSEAGVAGARTLLDRRTVVAGSAVVAAAAAATGAWYFLRSGPAQASNSIAVMPFANLSGDPSQAYFSDGLAEELRSALARIPELNVMARTSSEKVREDDIQTAARKLRVANILTGSVRRSPSTIRITTQLVDGQDGLERWSEAYDRPVGDTLVVQSDIAQKVAAALSIRLSRGAQSALEDGGTVNPAAQDLVLQVDQNLMFGRDQLENRIAQLNAAIAMDPNYGQAYARKAQLVMARAGTFSESADEAYRGHLDALEVADKAIAVAPRMARGYAARGDIFRQLLKMKAAFADAQRAQALPGKNDPGVLEFQSFLSAQIGRLQDASRVAQKLSALDPLSPLSIANEGIVQFYARQYPQAAVTFRRALQIAPTFVRARSFLGQALLQQNLTAEAAAEFSKIDSRDYHRLLGQAVIAARAGRAAEVFENMRKIQGLFGDAAQYQYGQIYAQVGKFDEAFAQLNRAVAVHDSGASGLRVDPLVDPLRKDPRFAALEAKLDYP